MNDITSSSLADAPFALLPLTPPHLQDNVSPSLAVRIANAAYNARRTEIAGGPDFGRELTVELNMLRPNASRDVVRFAMVPADAAASAALPAAVPAQDDETDLGFVAFLDLLFPLLEDVETAYASFTFVPGAECNFAAIFAALWEKMKAECAQRGRTAIEIEAFIAPDAVESDPLTRALADAGAELALVEQASSIELRTLPAGELTGLDAVTFPGIIPPEPYVDDILDFLTLAATDVPSAGEAEVPVWDRARLDDVAAHVARSGQDVVNLFLVDTDGRYGPAGRAVAFSTASRVPDTRPEIAQQGLTIVRPECRGHGLGRAVKFHLWAYLAENMPDITTVATTNALDNTAILAINRSLGMTPRAWETAWRYTPPARR